MWKLASLVWLMLGTVMAGALVLVVVALPNLAEQGMRLIPLAGIGGYLVAIPFALIVARKIAAQTSARA